MISNLSRQQQDMAQKIMEEAKVRMAKQAEEKQTTAAEKPGEGEKREAAAAAE